MRDLALVGGVLGFFAVCVAYVRACDRIIGREHVVAGTSDVSVEDSESIVEAAG